MIVSLEKLSVTGKYLLITFLIQSTCISAFSQANSQPKLSAPYYFELSSTYIQSGFTNYTEGYEFFYIDDSTTLITRKQGNFISDKSLFKYSNEIVRLEHDTIKSKSSRVTVFVENKEAQVFCFLHFNFYALATLQVNDSSVKVFSQELSTTTLEKTGKPLEIFSFHNGYKLDLNKTHNTLMDVPHCIKSSNGKYLLLAFAESHGETTKNNIHFKVFENSFENSWSRDYGLPAGSTCFEAPHFRTPELRRGQHCNESFEIDKFRMSNDGCVYFKGLETGKQKEKDYRKRTSSKNIFHIISFSAEQPEAFDQEISVDQRIVDFKIDKINNGKIIAIGYYSFSDDKDFITGHMDTEEDLDGIFYFAYSPGDKASVVKYLYPTPLEILDAENNSTGLIKVQPKHLHDYELRELFINEGGEATFLVEYEIYTAGNGTYTNSAGATYSSGGQHLINDILIYNFKLDGSLNWTRRLSKKAEPNKGDNDAYTFGSYMTYKNNVLYIFYAEDIRNPVSENRSDQYTYHGKNQGRFVCMSVDKNGVMIKQSLGVYKTHRKQCPPMSSIELYKGADQKYYFVVYRTIYQVFIPN